ncbi:FG-GAP repeat domain-containing protein [Streptomyces omiyaensis]|uniref:FG-GAP repeat domain-containing protein n=1 Tax=Streptomyces omiyaensis TaxID=68247 RepID=UPI0037025609
MIHARAYTSRRIAAAAVTVALAAAGVTAPAFTAAAAPATGQDQQDTAVSFPRNADVVGAGPSGFLSKTRGETPEYRWTWYADGASVVVPGAFVGGGPADLIAVGDETELRSQRVLRLRDMSTPASAAAAPVVVDLDAFGPRHRFAAVFGSTLAVSVVSATGTHRPHLLTVEDGKPVLRAVTGISGDCEPSLQGGFGAGAAVYDCVDAEQRYRKVVVDLVAAAAEYTAPADEPRRVEMWGAVSDAYAVWRESDATADWFGVHKRGTTERALVRATGVPYDPLHLVGGWIVQGQPVHIETSSFTDGASNPRKRPLTAWPIGTGGTVDDAARVELLTAHSSAVPGPGGTLLVRGGTADRGEGLYRISPSPEGGRPLVELVASTGQSTVVAVTGASVPKELTGEQAARGVDLAWDLSRGDSRVWLTVTHVSSGTTVYSGWPVANGAAGAPRRITWHWDGKDLEAGDWGAPARNGAYEWKLTARPDDGIGPEAVATGRFSVTRPAAAHDYDDDGTADLLTRDPEGVLWRYGTRPTAPGGSLTDTGGSRVGGGWKAYDRLASVGNVAGGPAPDTLARDRSGMLWLYHGTGFRHSPFTARRPIGGGWQVYDRITGGSDVTGDGRPDLLASDRTGVLWLYPGTGNSSAPFSARKKVGAGWGVYNELTAAGNLGGAKAGDLLARDRSGVLWLYLGKGDGTFTARKRVGAGWGAFTGLTAVGDANGDGRADLLAWNGDETFYAGTGDWSAPFKRRTPAALTQDSAYDTLF